MESSSSTNTHMKRKMTTIIVGTMLAIIGATLPASATVVNTNSRYLTVTRNHPRQVVLNRLTPRPEGMTVAGRLRSSRGDRYGRTGRG